MSDPRRPTSRMGRVKRDPRVDSVPPSARKAGPDSKREEGTAPDIDELLGRLLARATQAEVHAQHLEQTLQRLNEERVVIEARMAELVRQLEAADAHRASLEAQLKTTHSSRRSDGPVTLAYVKGMAAELMRALDRIVPNMTPSNLPMARTPSEIPTPRPRSDRPRR
jgi:hypothetical protein